MGGEIAVKPAEDFGLEGGLHGVAHFGRGRPDVLQINVASAGSLAERLGCQVYCHAARQGEGHDQRRRHEEIGLDVLVDARLEIAVAGKDGGGDDVIL